MSLRYLLDHNVQRAVRDSLRTQGIDVVSADEVGGAALNDERLLQLALEMKRVLVTHDQDFLVIAARYQRESGEFAGIVFCRLVGVTVQGMVEDLILTASVLELDEMFGQVVRVPL